MVGFGYTPGSSNIADTWKMGAPEMSRCMDPIKNGDVIPASYVIVYQRVVVCMKNGRCMLVRCVCGQNSRFF